MILRQLQKARHGLYFATAAALSLLFLLAAGPVSVQAATTHQWTGNNPPTVMDGDTVNIDDASGAPTGTLVVPDGATVILSGWVSDVHYGLTLNIGNGARVICQNFLYQTDESYADNFTLLTAIGSGVLELSNNVYISHMHSGRAIAASCAEVLVGGEGTNAASVEATTGTAIDGGGPTTIVRVNGGNVWNTAGSNVNPVINMTLANNTDTNVIVSKGSVYATSDSSRGYAIQTYGNVLVNGGTVDSRANEGRAITLAGVNSSATVMNGGRVIAEGDSGVAISTLTDGRSNENGGTGDVDQDMLNASVVIDGGTVSANSVAIRMRGQNSSVTVNSGSVSSRGNPGADAIDCSEPGSSVAITGGTVWATTGYAVSTPNAATVSVSGGFVFAYGEGITGTGNVVWQTGFAPTGSGVVVAWNADANNRTYVEETTVDLVVDPPPDKADVV